MSDEPRIVTKAHVEQAVDELKKEGLLSDTSYGPDGKRGERQWINAINEDMGLIRLKLKDIERDEGRVSAFAVAAKEARRMLSDIYRMADDCYEIKKKDIDEVRV